MHEGGERGACFFCLCITHCLGLGFDPADFFVLNMTSNRNRFMDQYIGVHPVPRSRLAATSLPNLGVAIFAGGLGSCCDVHLGSCGMHCFLRGTRA